MEKKWDNSIYGYELYNWIWIINWNITFSIMYNGMIWIFDIVAITLVNWNYSLSLFKTNFRTESSLAIVVDLHDYTNPGNYIWFDIAQIIMVRFRNYNSYNLSVYMSLALRLSRITKYIFSFTEYYSTKGILISFLRPIYVFNTVILHIIIIIWKKNGLC